MKLQGHLREGGWWDCKVAERAGRLWEGARQSSEAGGEELRGSLSGATPSCRNSEIRICSFHIPYSHDLCPSRCMHFLDEEFVDALLQKRLGTCRTCRCCVLLQTKILLSITSLPCSDLD